MNIFSQSYIQALLYRKVDFFAGNLPAGKGREGKVFFYFL
jgi:hypothetical protein